MALSGAIIYEIESGGSNSNAGGFDSSQHANMATDGAATSATSSSPVFTSASYNFVSGDVGAWLFIYSGTNWIPGWYQIASVASNAATLTATTGTTVNYNGYIAQPSQGTVTGCATTASPTGATWTVDYSQQTSAQIAYTDIVIDATTNTKATSSAHPFTVNMIGNMISISSGTGFTVQPVVLQSISAGVATFDKALGTTSSTGGHGALGGAFATFANFMWAASSSNLQTELMLCYVKSATYTMTSTNDFWTPNPAFVGYGTTRGDNGQPTITTSTNSTDLFNLGLLTLAQVYFKNFIFTNTATTRANAFQNNGSNNVEVVQFENCIFNGVKSSIECNANFPSVFRIHMRNCTIENTTSYGVDWTYSGVASSQLHLDGCIIKGGATHGIFIQSVGTRMCILNHCVIYNNGGSGVVVANDSNNYLDATVKIMNSAIVGNTNDGVKFGSGGTWFAKWFESYNSIYTQNGGYGWNFEAAQPSARGHYVNGYGNAFYGNTSGARNNILAVPGEITLTGDPFTSKSTGDFTLNSTAGAGAACKGVGWPTVIPS